jgi:hypothetical protein
MQQAFGQTTRLFDLEIEDRASWTRSYSWSFALPLEDDEVGIGTCGLNFHDVLTAMGHIESGPLRFYNIDPLS